MSDGLLTRPEAETRTEIDPSTGEPRCTHIVAGDGELSAVTIVMRARINGTPVTAICGYTWVPERDPKQYPLCSKCREIRETLRPDQNVEDITP